MAYQLQGFDLAVLKDHFFRTIVPVCGPNLLTPAPPVWSGFNGQSLCESIRQREQELRRSAWRRCTAFLNDSLLRLYFRSEWKTLAGELTRHWNFWRYDGAAPTRIASLAHQALLLEAGAEPKPGLVCPGHNGAHTDMTHATFVASAAAIRPYFARCVTLGYEHGEAPAPELLPALRDAGCAAEAAMFAATGGVNTHKGAIFSLGLLCAACGRFFARAQPLHPYAVAQEAASIVQGIVERDLGHLKIRLPDRKLTAGERLYLEHGTGGIRQEAEQGFPTALAGFFALESAVAHMPLAQALPHTLLHLMADAADTNVLSRGGQEGLDFVQAQARKALAQGGMQSEKGRATVAWMTGEFTRRNLSPGGAADMLALTAFFLLLEHAGTVPAPE